MRFTTVAVAAFAVVASGLGYSMLREHHRASGAETETRPSPAREVDVVRPRAESIGQEVRLPADVEAFYVAAIHARVNGYVKAWYKDIGARVHAGDVLADIDTPELDQRLNELEGQLSRAQADLQIAHVTAQRWTDLLKSNAVSKQTADEKVGDAKAQEAQVSAARANLDRVRALLAFKRLVAPFDGVVTERRIDVGQLVSATDDRGLGLFDVAQTGRVRVYIRVPQADSYLVKRGMAVRLRVPNLPGVEFTGRVTTTSDSISEKARSLLVEALFDNSDGRLSPGAFAEASFTGGSGGSRVLIPDSAMLFRGDQPKVAVVRGGRAQLISVQIAKDNGRDLEVTGGLKADDEIIRAPWASIANGDEVKVRSERAKADPASKRSPG